MCKFLLQSLSIFSITYIYLWLSFQSAIAQEQSDNQDAAQVTSVSQLEDVQPTDWAFQALQSLVERYGCIAGYPDETYRGKRALTRYEFAAGLNVCLDRLNEQIASSTFNLVQKEDITILKRLQDEFTGELATLRGLVDHLEDSTDQLEAHQFSPTTKLNGLAWINVTNAGSTGGGIRGEAVSERSSSGSLSTRVAGRDPVTGKPNVIKVSNPNTTLSTLVWLTLNTSFTGKDALVTQLAAGNGISPANQYASAGQFNTFGVPYFDQTAGSTNGSPDVVIRELSYRFPINNQIQAVVGPRINWYRYFDNNRFTSILTGANSYNSNSSTLLNTLDRGSGAVLQIKPSKQFQVNIGYLGENNEFLPSSLFNTSSDPTRGLFGGTNSATAELTYSPNHNINLRFLYHRSRLQQRNGIIGGSVGEPLYGTADNGFGAVILDPTKQTVANGGLDSSTADTYEVNFDWLVNPKFGLFGRYTYGSTHLKPINKDVNVQAIQGGLAFRDLGKQGALGTISFVIPFSILDGRKFLISNGGNGGIEYDFEANYYYPVTDHIAIVPAFYFIMNPNNFSDNPGIYVVNMRAQFSF